jgi:hypothetical protein
VTSRRRNRRPAHTLGGPLAVLPFVVLGLLALTHHMLKEALFCAAVVAAACIWRSRR